MITLEEKWPNVRSVLDTPHELNQFLILKPVRIENKRRMDGPMAEIVSHEDLDRIKVFLFDTQMANNPPPFLPEKSSGPIARRLTQFHLSRELIYRLQVLTEIITVTTTATRPANVPACYFFVISNA